MHIYYDLEVLHPDKLETYNKESLYVLYAIKDFLMQRFGVLEDQMDKEWESNQAFVMLLTPKTEGDQLLMGFPNFSDDLKMKLESCLTEQDYEYLNQKMSKNLF